MNYLGHELVTLNSVITIPTACEVCSSFTWLKEKGLVCQSCRLTCHKKVPSFGLFFPFSFGFFFLLTSKNRSAPCSS